jgi:hypothetical protein
MNNALAVYALPPVAAPAWANRAPSRVIENGQVIEPDSQHANAHSSYAQFVEVGDRGALSLIAAQTTPYLLPSQPPPARLANAAAAYQTAADRANRPRPGKNWDSWA